MEIIVDSAGYPTEQIARNSHDYRPLGLGYANLGALLMAFGLPYDSDAGRDFAATLTSILCGDAYWQSSRIAETCPALGAATPLTQQAHIAGGACPGFYVNREPFLDVIRDRKSTRLNSSHANISYAVFCLKKKDRKCYSQSRSKVVHFLKGRYGSRKEIAGASTMRLPRLTTRQSLSVTHDILVTAAAWGLS